jgi:hypothetical protein
MNPAGNHFFELAELQKTISRHFTSDGYAATRF